MEPKDIIVGRKYKHGNNKRDIYLGIGKRTMWTESMDNTGQMDEKHLIIIDSADKNQIGLIVKEGDDCIEGYWDEFQLINVTPVCPKCKTDQNMIKHGTEWVCHGTHRID